MTWEVGKQGVTDTLSGHNFNTGAHGPGSFRRDSFFITNKGFIGFGSIETAVGDTLAVLFGGKMPFVLREARGVDHMSDVFLASDTPMSTISWMVRRQGMV